MLHVGLRRQLLYTDAASNAAPVLCASRRVAVTARIGDIDVHVHGVVERIMCARRCSCLVLQGS